MKITDRLKLGSVRKLPLWRTCVEEMLEEGVEYGQVFKAEFFEEKLDATKDTFQYSLAVSKVRRELEREGFYLSGRGQNGTQFVILQPAHNVDIMRHYSKVARDALTRGVILGTSTRLDLLTEGERAKHETVLEKIATRQVLVSRADSIRRLVEKHEPKLLS